MVPYPPCVYSLVPVSLLFVCGPMYDALTKVLGATCYADDDLCSCIAATGYSYPIAVNYMARTDLQTARKQ